MRIRGDALEVGSEKNKRGVRHLINKTLVDKIVIGTPFAFIVRCAGPRTGECYIPVRRVPG